MPPDSKKITFCLPLFLREMYILDLIRVRSSTHTCLGRGRDSPYSYRPTAEELKYEVFAPYVERLKALFPEWNGRAQTPEESVTEMLNSVAKMSTKDTGVFVSHHGDENWL